MTNVINIETSLALPTCINHGCNKKVAYSTTYANGTKRYRPHCSHCQKASYGGQRHAYGVTPFKTGRCSNENDQLGFPCYTNWDKVAKTGGHIKTNIDHIDGDHLNNVLDNCQELCDSCHHIKSKMSGDYSSGRHQYQ